MEIDEKKVDRLIQKIESAANIIAGMDVWLPRAIDSALHGHSGTLDRVDIDRMLKERKEDEKRQTEMNSLHSQVEASQKQTKEIAKQTRYLFYALIITFIGFVFDIVLKINSNLFSDLNIKNMDNLFLLLFLVSLVCLIVGLINPKVFDRLKKGLMTRKKIGLIFGISTIIFFILFGVFSDTQTKQEEVSSTNTENKQLLASSTQTNNNPVSKTAGCIVPDPSISYSLLNESSRQSDVKSISIKECYILLTKKSATIVELTKLATELGKNNENIEFQIFDDSQAYQLYKKYIITHKEDDASDKDWKFLYDHYLAWYLKANTQLKNNYLQPVGNAYSTSIPQVVIVN